VALCAGEVRPLARAPRRALRRVAAGGEARPADEGGPPPEVLLAGGALVPVTAVVAATAGQVSAESSLFLAAGALVACGLALQLSLGHGGLALAGDEVTGSDLMETLPQGTTCCDEATLAVQLVSLGSYCGIKATFKNIGRGAAHMPFDWMRTRLDGLLHFIRTDFDGFFNYITKVPVPGEDMVLYRSRLHSFWHDDPTSLSVQEKFQRRITRFNGIDAKSRKVLFVRAAAATSELSRAPELLGLLQERFGEQAHLLLVLDHQKTTHGAITVAEHPQLLIYCERAEALDDPFKPYNAAVERALDWAIGRDVPITAVPSLDGARELADEFYIPEAYGVRIFEDA